MEIGKAIYAILNDADIQDDLAIYPEQAPADADMPFIVYSVQNIRPSDVKGSTSQLDEATLELYTVGTNYSEVMDVSAACRAALDRNSGTFNGVAVQSVNFDTAEILYNEPQEAYYVEQQYTVRVLITGTAPAANLLPLSASTIQIKEVDGSPSAASDTLIFPDGTLTLSAGEATYSPVYNMGTFKCNAQRLMNGGTPLDVGGSTEVRIPLEDEVYTSGSDIGLTASGGFITFAVDGIYRLTALATFSSDTHGHCPHMYFKVEGRQLDGEAGGMIPAQHGADHQPAMLSRVEAFSANERCSLWAYDESTKGGSIYLTLAMLDVERMA